MKYFISTNKKEISSIFKQKLEERLLSEGFTYDKENPDIVFSIGGDGTFLKLINQYLLIDPLFCSINTGNVGFLCNFDSNDIENIVNLIKENKLVEIPLLKLSGFNVPLYALNEFRIFANNAESISFDIYINDDYFERFKGSGLIISSSIGSSGVAKSFGGPLIDTKLNCLEIVEVGGILNSSYRCLKSTLVLNEKTTIKINNFSNGTINLCYDNNSFKLDNFKGELDIHLSSRKIKLLNKDEKEYYKKVKEVFLNE